MEGFLLMKVNVMKNADIDLETLNRLREFISKIFEKGGYSDSPWRNHNYDPWATWFWVEHGKRILATMRIIEKAPENWIPLEIAVIDDGGNPAMRYAVVENNVADWNSIAFEPTKFGVYAAKSTFRTVAKYCFEKGFEVVYGLYNTKQFGIKRLYFGAGAMRSNRYSSEVYFPDFRFKGELAKFHVIELKPETLKRIAFNF